MSKLEAIQRKDSTGKYTDEFREQVVRTYLNTNKTKSDVARSYSLPSGRYITEWLAYFGWADKPASPKKEPRTYTSEEIEENCRELMNGAAHKIGRYYTEAFRIAVVEEYLRDTTRPLCQVANKYGLSNGSDITKFMTTLEAKGMMPKVNNRKGKTAEEYYAEASERKPPMSLKDAAREHFRDWSQSLKS
jgi:transposase-like protein